MYLFLSLFTALAADVPLNQASAAQLAEIDGVSSSDAVAVVDLREERGRLNSVEELRILAVTPETLDALRRSVTLDLEAPAKSKKTYNNVDDVLAVFDPEPSIQDVQQLAMLYTYTHRDQVEAWMQATKTGPALPQLSVKYRYTDVFKQDFDYTDQGTAFDLTDGEVDNGWYTEVQVKWQLNELVMSSEKIRVISETQDVAKLRDKVLSDVTRLYFDRRRLQVDMLLNPSNDMRTQLDHQLRLMELTAELDAYTGGAFSASVSAAQ